MHLRLLQTDCAPLPCWGGFRAPCQHPLCGCDWHQLLLALPGIPPLSQHVPPPSPTSRGVSRLTVPQPLSCSQCPRGAGPTKSPGSPGPITSTSLSVVSKLRTTDSHQPPTSVPCCVPLPPPVTNSACELTPRVRDTLPPVITSLPRLMPPFRGCESPICCSVLMGQEGDRMAV